MCGSVLLRLFFGPGHLNAAVVLRAASAPHSVPAVCVIVVIRADAGEAEHRVTIFDQLSLLGRETAEGHT